MERSPSKTRFQSVRSLCGSDLRPRLTWTADKLNFHDPKDPTSLLPSTRLRCRTSRGVHRPLRIGIPLDYNIATLDPTARKAWINVLKLLWEHGHTLHPVRLPATQHALSAYYILAPAEASSNLAKYDGVRYGSRAEGVDGTPDSVLFAKTRGQGFGPEVQRRILLGAFSLSAQAIDNYFIQAQKVRRLVQKDFDRVFAMSNPLLDDTSLEEEEDDDEKVDILICPTAPSLAPLLSDVANQDSIQAYQNDVFTVPASLAGLPAISVPIPTSNTDRDVDSDIHPDSFQTTSIQIIGQYGDDALVLNAAKQLQSLVPTPQYPTGSGRTAWSVNFLAEESSIDRHWNKESKQQARTKASRDQMTMEQLTALFYSTVGKEYIDGAAARFGEGPTRYMGRFLSAKNPVDAERNHQHNRIMVKEKSAKIKAKGKAREKTPAAIGKGNVEGHGSKNDSGGNAVSRIRFVGTQHATKIRFIAHPHVAKVNIISQDDG